jgi:hypothetical protein
MVQVKHKRLVCSQSQPKSPLGESKLFWMTKVALSSPCKTSSLSSQTESLVFSLYSSTNRFLLGQLYFVTLGSSLPQLIIISKTPKFKTISRTQTLTSHVICLAVDSSLTSDF